MLIISVGMVKSGSGWLFNMINEILIASGYSDVREIRKKFKLEDLLKHHNCSLDQLTNENLDLLTSSELKKNTFCVKTHSNPVNGIKNYLKENLLKIIYIYRDPRDIVLSLLDHGKKIRSEGQTHSFAQVDNIEKAVKLVENELMKKREWEKIPDVHILQYEKLLGNTIAELNNICEFLDVSISELKLKNIIESNSFDIIKESNKKGFHFNKGRSFRYKIEMDLEEKKYCDKIFKKYLKQKKFFNII